MYCHNCGAQNNAESSFCRNCGTRLQQAAAQAVPAQPAREGVLAAAWNDIKGTPGWARKVLLLCLVGCIPILNFAVEGYALRWGRDLSFGKRENLPKEIFKKKEIVTGFRAFVLSFALGFAFGFISFVLMSVVSALLVTLASLFVGGGNYSQSFNGIGMFILILSAAIGIVFFFLFFPFINCSIMRMTVVDYLEAGLNTPKVLAKFRASMGEAIVATIVPSLIVSAIAVVAVLLFSAIFGVALTGAVQNAYAMANRFSSPMGFAGMGLAGLMMYVALPIALMMLYTFGQLLTWRAMGHWAARNAPEWKDESDEAVIVDMAADFVGSMDVPASGPSAPADSRMGDYHAGAPASTPAEGDGSKRIYDAGRNPNQESTTGAPYRP